MGRHIYSVFEYKDGNTGKWEAANLFRLYGEGAYGLTQLLTGGDMEANALFARESFDMGPVKDPGENDCIESKIQRIDEIIDGLKSSRPPLDASNAAKKFYGRYEMVLDSRSKDVRYHPECVTYSLRDLELIECLVKGTTFATKNYYDKHFAAMRWLLHTIMRMEYIGNANHVRAIIWSC